MKRLIQSVLCLLFMLALTGRQVMAADNGEDKAYFGVIPLTAPLAEKVGSNGARVAVAGECQQCVVNGTPAPLLPAKSALTVLAVLNVSPAARAGLQSGDCIVGVGRYPVRSAADLRKAVARYGPGADVEVRWFRQGALCAMRVQLTARPADLHQSAAIVDVNALVHETERTIELSRDADSRIRYYKSRIWAQLQLLPGGEMHVQSVINDLQAMRDIAASCHVQQPGWMAGRACDATLEFRDSMGKIILRGANNVLTLTLVDKDGHTSFHAPLNSPEVQQAISAAIRSRLLRNGED